MEHLAQKSSRPGSKINTISDVSRVFLGRLVDTSNPGRCHCHVWCRAEKFSKFVSPDTLKMDSLATSLLRFLRKTLFKLLKLSLQKTLSWMIFKKSYIHIPNLSGYKLVRAAKQDGASSTKGITQGSVNYLRKRKSEYSRDLLCS